MKKKEKIKKIAIITFHNAINYGAILQSFALQSFLNEKYDCEVLDYQCDKIVNNYKYFYNIKSLKNIITSIIKFPFAFLKNKRFKKFIKKNIKMSSKKYYSNNVNTADDIYDCFITGSDQVWNLNITNNDMAYFLNFTSKKKLSYAASNGKKEMSEEDFSIVKKYLKEFNYLSVREMDLQNDLSKKMNKNIDKVLDPVFLLEKKQWSKLLPAKGISQKYILIYILHEESIYEIASKMSKILNMQIICIQNNYKRPIKAKYKIGVGINEFLRLINDAEYVITDSFHGTALSIVFRKNLRIVMKTTNIAANTRLQSLIDEFDLNDNVVSLDSSNNQLIASTKYNEIKINKSILDSKNKLMNAIGD